MAGITFAGLRGVSELVYEEAFPVAKLGFSVPAAPAAGARLQMSLFASSQLTPGDTNASNTPAVTFTLRVKLQGRLASAVAVPVNVSFLILGGLGLRSDWAQVKGPGQTGPWAAATSRAECAAACTKAGGCYAWQWAQQPNTTNSANRIPAKHQCLLDHTGYAQGSYPATRGSTDSGFPGGFATTDRSVVFSTDGPAPKAGGKLHNAIGSQGFFAVANTSGPVLRLFPPHAPSSHA